FASADDMRLRLQEWLMRSGPLLTEQHIARAVSERVGKTIEDRAERIQRCLRASRRVEIATGSDLTFLPTTSTSGKGASLFTRSGPRSRKMPRLIGAAAAVLLLGVIGTLSLTSDDEPDKVIVPAAPAANVSPPTTAATPPASAVADAKATEEAAKASDSSKPASSSADRRGPLSLPEAMARALAERKEREARSGSKSRSGGSGASDARSRGPELRPASSVPRGGAQRGSSSNNLGPLEKDL
ncbi:MAG TPA: hypothetical protein VMG12_28835, partial [Polyangiaceae bacterium]|nr:hypothetical protein [Polyangiaceae bacterium]